MRRLLLLAALCSFPLFAGPTDVGSAPSVQVVIGAKGSDGNLARLKVCDSKHAFSSALAAGTSMQLLSITAPKKVYVCGFYLGTAALTSASFFEDLDACSTESRIVAAPAYLAKNSGIVMSPTPFAVAFTAYTTSTSLCLKSSASSTLSGWISYTIQ